MSAAKRHMRWVAQVPALCACLVFGAAAPSQAAEESALVRLTPAQYEHSIHDIFGESIQVDSGIVDPGGRENGLLALGARKLTLSAAALERYESLARQVAVQVTDDRHRATLELVEALEHTDADGPRLEIDGAKPLYQTR